MKKEIEKLLLVLGLLFATVLFGCSRKPVRMNTITTPTKRLEFAWPVPLKFQVEEQFQRGSERIKFMHTLSLETNRNDELVLRWLDVEVKSVNKQPIGTPESKKAAELASAVYHWLPPIRISRTGHFLGIGNNSESLNNASTLSERVSTDLSVGSHQDIPQATGDPAVQRMSQQIISRCWNAWVEAWIGLDASKGEVRRREAQSQVGTEKDSFEPDIQNFGVTRTNSNFVFLRRRELVGRVEAIGSATNELSQITNQDTGAEKSKPAGSHSIRQEMRAEAITEAKSLMPSWASYNVEEVQDLPKGRKMTLLERHKYRFIWPEFVTAHK